MRPTRAGLCAGGMLLVLTIAAAPASGHGGGSFSEVPLPERAVVNWLAAVPGSTPVRELSLPGTHDTMARFGGRIAQTQVTGLRGQLDAGVRALDIRLRREVVAGDNVFVVTHGPVPQQLFDVVMATVNGFLLEHPSETVLMRVVRDQSDPDRDAFNSLFRRYMETYGDLAWATPDNELATNPSLAELRGKVVFLPQSFDARRGLAPLGIPWNSGNFDLSYQEEWRVCSRRGLADRWGDIRTQLRASGAAVAEKIFVNHLSGNMDVFPGCPLPPADVDPRFVASGLETGTFDPAGTGKLIDCTEPQDPAAADWDTCPSFFHVDADAPGCGRTRVPACPVYYEGTNALTLRFIREGHVSRRAGLVMIDFPATGLIEAIIALNPTNGPPVADAGGPYAAAEGAVVTLDASGSSDPSGDPLRYRWDLDGDGTWDTASSTDPHAPTTWPDDHLGTVRVQVSDGIATATDQATVTVSNVAPDVSIDSLDGGLPSIALVAVPVELGGSFADPGTLDTHEARVLWGDGDSDDLGAVEATDPIAATHTFGVPGERTVRLAVTDDDGGIGHDEADVTVYDAAGAIRAVIEKLDRELSVRHDRRTAKALRAMRDDLDGKHLGRKRNGAIDYLERGEESAALAKVRHALGRSAKLGDDLADCRTLLALAARSLAQLAYDEAAAAAHTRSRLRKVDRLEVLLRKGVQKLEAGELRTAVSYFRSVVTRA